VRGRATARSNGREPEICAYRASSPIDCRLEAHKDAADLPVHRAPVAREAASGAPSRRRRRRKRGAQGARDGAFEWRRAGNMRTCNEGLRRWQ
jgi:hypothetical protein